MPVCSSSPPEPSRTVTEPQLRLASSECPAELACSLGLVCLLCSTRLVDHSAFSLFHAGSGSALFRPDEPATIWKNLGDYASYASPRVIIYHMHADGQISPKYSHRRGYSNRLAQIARLVAQVFPDDCERDFCRDSALVTMRAKFDDPFPRL